MPGETLVLSPREYKSTPCKRVRVNRLASERACRGEWARDNYPFCFPAGRGDVDRNEMKETVIEAFPDLGVLLFLHETDAVPSHVLLFMSEHPRSVF